MSQQTIASKVPLETRSFNTRKANYRADYGTLVVPEHRGPKTARSITLPLIRIRSPHPHPAEPLFWLAGGPGMSNLSYKPPDWLLANHDVVLLGYRGVDGSVALESPEIIRAFRKTGGDLLSDQSLRNFHHAFAQTYQRIRSKGVDVEGYTIPEVVADLEMARDTLGYSRIDLLSVSYGTRVARSMPISTLSACFARP